jgi:hypothetical protein
LGFGKEEEAWMYGLIGGWMQVQKDMNVGCEEIL